jgi:hypothetical protein
MPNLRQKAALEGYFLMKFSIMQKLKHSLKLQSRHCLIKKGDEINYPKAMLKKNPPKKPPTPEQIELGKRVKEAVLSLGHGGQTEIAKACGIEPQSVNGWFRTGRIGKQSLLIVAEMTQFNYHWLLTGSGPKRESDKSQIQSTLKTDVNQNNQTGNINISRLMPLASPATQEILKTLEAGLKNGKLREEDIKMLDSIAKRMIDD